MRAIFGAQRSVSTTHGGRVILLTDLLPSSPPSMIPSLLETGGQNGGWGENGGEVGMEWGYNHSDTRRKLNSEIFVETAGEGEARESGKTKEKAQATG